MRPVTDERAPRPRRVPVTYPIVYADADHLDLFMDARATTMDGLCDEFGWPKGEAA